MTFADGQWVRLAQPDNELETWARLAPDETGRLRIVGLYLNGPTPITGTRLRALRPALIEDRLNSRDARETSRKPLTRPPGRALSAQFYGEVAAAYRAALHAYAPPAPFIAEEAGVPQTTATGWVQEARRRGHLGAAIKGRAGEGRDA